MLISQGLSHHSLHALVLIISFAREQSDNSVLIVLRESHVSALYLGVFEDLSVFEVLCSAHEACEGEFDGGIEVQVIDLFVRECSFVRKVFPLIINARELRNRCCNPVKLNL